MSAPTWILYGANGHTGHRIARESTSRGQKPILAGRNTRAVERIARELQCPCRVFTLDDPSQVAEQIRGATAVLHCAGPFSATALPMMEACFAAKVNYLDITGEISVIEAAAARHDRAVAAGVSLLPAVAFTPLAGDCLVAMLAARLPAAARLQVAYTTMGSISPGTARTVVEQMPASGKARRNGQLVESPIAGQMIDVPFPAGPQSAAMFGLADLVTAWHTTHIPCIETFVAMPAWKAHSVQKLQWLGSAVKVDIVRDAMASMLRGAWSVAGPAPSSGERAAVWARLSDQQNQLAEAVLETIDAYRFTVFSALAAVERVAAGGVAPGFLTPSKAFGPEFALQVPETKLQWIASPAPAA